MQATFNGASLGVAPLGWFVLSYSAPTFSTPQADIFLQAESAVVGGITFSGDKVGQTERHEGAAYILFHTLLSYPCFISLHHTIVSYPCRLPLAHTTVANPCYIPAAGGGRAGGCLAGARRRRVRPDGGGQRRARYRPAGCLSQKGGRQAGQGAPPQVVAVFGLSPFVVVFLALLASPFFGCQDNLNDEVAGRDGQQGGTQDRPRVGKRG